MVPAHDVQSLSFESQVARGAHSGASLSADANGDMVVTEISTQCVKVQVPSALPVYIGRPTVRVTKVLYRPRTITVQKAVLRMCAARY